MILRVSMLVCLLVCVQHPGHNSTPIVDKLYNNAYLRQELEGKYTEWPNPQITEHRACDRQSGLNDSAP